jgi:inhibitor of cysteine peptidase
MATIEVDDSGIGRTHELRVGDELVLRLPENPTTGFRWQVEPSGESALLSLEDRFQPGGTSPVPGAGGHHIFRFAASRPGTVHLALAHRQAWEPGGDDASQLTLIIHP